MSILTRNFVLAIVYVLDQLLSLYSMILFVAILITWVNPDPRNPIVRFLHSVTEPVVFGSFLRPSLKQALNFGRRVEMT